MTEASQQMAPLSLLLFINSQLHNLLVRLVAASGDFNALNSMHVDCICISAKIASRGSSKLLFLITVYHKKITIYYSIVHSVNYSKHNIFGIKP